jgi:uncharacterized protein (DUF362 family)
MCSLRQRWRGGNLAAAGIGGNPLHAVAVVDDPGLSAGEKLAVALERAGFWESLPQTTDARIVIKPELAGFACGSPTATDPALVEELIDLLHDRGFANVAVVGAADSSALWAANRELYALCDLLGYRFATSKQRNYEIIDLAHETIAAFPATSALRGSGISRTWLEADTRIVFSKNRTDEADGYALCLDTLIGVLPLTDKDLHYRKRRHPGDVVSDLLAIAPVHFGVIDAMVSAHGTGGRRAPKQIGTQTVIAASNLVLADYIGALKMGVDPAMSPIFARAVRSHALPRRYTISGCLTAYLDWQNVPATSLAANRMRRASEVLDRLVEPWLQQLDPSLFPLKHPIDSRLNAALAEGIDEPLLTLANLVAGSVGKTISSYQTLFDKDTLYQQAVPLGIDHSAVPGHAFDDLVRELELLEPVAGAAPQASDDLRWRYVGEAVVFNYTRSLPVAYDLFVRRVDIARTIQFMNDYLGGVLIPLAHDEAGRPVRQAERNIYLPQPNYMVLYEGKPIDVSKLEVVNYAPDRHRLYWKTIFSDNGSALHDDGIASFERVAGGTRVTIMGRQQFALPPFWQVFDLDLMPELKSVLVTHAYRIFFDRTMANFEALVEGRDVRLGRSIDQPVPRPIEQLMPLLKQVWDVIAPLLRRTPEPMSGHLDADGFMHFIPSNVDQQVKGAPERWVSEVTRFLDGLSQATRRDLA